MWLKIAKKRSCVPSLTDDEAIDVGLCYGRISDQRKSYDEVYYLQKYAPRRPRSGWSQVNVTKVAGGPGGGPYRRAEARRGPLAGTSPPPVAASLAESARKAQEAGLLSRSTSRGSATSAC